MTLCLTGTIQLQSDKCPFGLLRLHRPVAFTYVCMMRFLSMVAVNHVIPLQVRILYSHYYNYSISELFFCQHISELKRIIYKYIKI